MKLFLVTSLLIGGVTARRNAFESIKRAKQVRFLLSVADGSFLDTTESLDPTVDWESETEFGDVTVKYGVKAQISTKEGATRTAWAGAYTDTDNGWKIAAKGDLDLNDRNSVDLELDLLNVEMDTSIGVDATLETEDGFNMKWAELHKATETNLFDRPGNLDIKARYTFEDSKAEVEIGYESDATSAEIIASADEKSVKISREVGDFAPFLRNAKYSVTISDKEDNTYQYERVLDEDGKLSAMLKVGDKAAVEWKDNGWVASAKSDLEGLTPTNPEVNIRREVAF